MSYRVVDPETSDDLPNRPCLTRSISESIENGISFDQLGIRIYVAEPGEQLPLQYHYHETQEEAFYVISGALHVETPERAYTVDEGKLFLVEPESPHRAFNPEKATTSIRILAMGAPTTDDGLPYEPSV